MFLSKKSVNNRDTLKTCLLLLVNQFYNKITSSDFD